MKISLVFPVANSTTPPKLLGMFFTTPSPTLFVSANSARLNKSDLECQTGNALPNPSPPLGVRCLIRGKSVASFQPVGVTEQKLYTFYFFCFVLIFLLRLKIENAVTEILPKGRESELEKTYRLFINVHL